MRRNTVQTWSGTKTPNSPAKAKCINGKNIASAKTLLGPWASGLNNHSGNNTMRNIKTKYYVGKRYSDPIQTNSASDANMAIAQSVLRMQIGFYTDSKGNAATSCEVYDNESGQLHAVVTRSPASGQIQITYKRDPAKYETRLAIGAIVGKQ
jgi:hypothetical protein